MSLRLSLSAALVLAAGAVSLANAQATPARPGAPGCCAAKPAATADSAGCCAMNPAQPRADCPMTKMGQGGPMPGMQHRMGGEMGGMKGMGGMGGMTMPMPSAADQARLDSLVTVMHQSKGDKKVAAMEKVLNELLAHRAAMMEHMQHMQHMMQGMDSAAPSGEHQHD